MTSIMEKGEYFAMYQVEDSLWWYKSLQDVLSYWIGKYNPKKAIILDSGCGTGKNIEFLQSKEYRMEGFDLSSDAISFCHKRNISQTKVGDSTHIEYNSQTFDSVIHMDVFGLIDEADRQKVIQEIYRVLKPGGYLHIHSAALEWLRSQHDDVCHLKTRFTKNQLESYFDTNQWTIIKSSYRIFLLFIPIAVVKIFKRFTKTNADHSEGDLQVPHRFLNWMLYKIQQFEDVMLRWITLPIGSSIYIIIQKK